MSYYKLTIMCSQQISLVCEIMRKFDFRNMIALIVASFPHFHCIPKDTDVLMFFANDSLDCKMHGDLFVFAHLTDLDRIRLDSLKE